MSRASAPLARHPSKALLLPTILPPSALSEDAASHPLCVADPPSNEASPASDAVLKHRARSRLDSSSSEEKSTQPKMRASPSLMLPPSGSHLSFHGACSPKAKGRAAASPPFTDTAKKYHEALANAPLLHEATVISDATISRGCVQGTLLHSEPEPPNNLAKRCDVASGIPAVAYLAARPGAPPDELRAELERFIAAPSMIRGAPPPADSTAARLPLVADALEAARCDEVAQLLALLRPVSGASDEAGRANPAPFSFPSVLREDDAGLPRVGARLRAQTTCGAPDSEGPLSSLWRALAADEGLAPNHRGGYHPRTSSISLAELQLRASLHAEGPAVVLDTVEESSCHDGAPDSFSHLTRLTEAAALPCSAQASPPFPCHRAPAASSMAAARRTPSNAAVTGPATPGAAQLTLIVNVPPTTTRQDLLNAFKTFGQVLMPTVVCRKETRHPKKEWTATAGYAFVLFGTKTAAQAALAATEAGTVIIRGTPVKATWAKKDSFRTKATALGTGPLSSTSSGNPSEAHITNNLETHLYGTTPHSQHPHPHHHHHHQGSDCSSSSTGFYGLETRSASQAAMRPNADHVVNDAAVEWYSRALGSAHTEAPPFSTTMIPTHLPNQQRRPFTSDDDTQTRHNSSFYCPPSNYDPTPAYCDTDLSVGVHLCFAAKGLEPSFSPQSAPLLAGTFSEPTTKAAFSSAASTSATTMTTSPLSSASSACSLTSARRRPGVTAPPPSPARSDFFVNQQQPQRKRPTARSFCGTITTAGSISPAQPMVSTPLPSASAGCSLSPAAWSPPAVAPPPPPRNKHFFAQQQPQQQHHRVDGASEGSLLSMPPSAALHYPPPDAQSYPTAANMPSPYAAPRHPTPFFFVLGGGAEEEEGQRQSLERQRFNSQPPSLFNLPATARKTDEASYGLRLSAATDLPSVLMQQQASRLPLPGVPLTTATPHHRLLHR